MLKKIMLAIVVTMGIAMPVYAMGEIKEIESPTNMTNISSFDFPGGNTGEKSQSVFESTNDGASQNLANVDNGDLEESFSSSFDIGSSQDNTTNKSELDVPAFEESETSSLSDQSLELAVEESKPEGSANQIGGSLNLSSGTSLQELTESMKANAANTLSSLMGSSFTGLDADLFGLDSMPNISMEDLNVQYADLLNKFTEKGFGTTPTLEMPSFEGYQDGSAQDVFKAAFGDMLGSEVKKFEIPSDFDVKSMIYANQEKRAESFAGFKDTEVYKTVSENMSIKSTVAETKLDLKDYTFDDIGFKAPTLDDSLELSEPFVDSSKLGLGKNYIKQTPTPVPKEGKRKISKSIRSNMPQSPSEVPGANSQDDVQKKNNEFFNNSPASDEFANWETKKREADRQSTIRKKMQERKAAQTKEKTNKNK